MFDIFTSRNVKKNLLISTLTSDQDQNLESVDSQICQTFWEEYVGPESLIVDTLGVYCMSCDLGCFNLWAVTAGSDLWAVTAGSNL